MDRPYPRYSIVIPVYNNEGTIHQLCERISWIDSQLDHQVEAVFVVDGSPDNSDQLLADLLSSESFSAQLLTHSRNFGSFSAIATGLAAAKGEYLAVMAADLQEPAELIVEFFNELSRDQVQVVVGVRESRNDSRLSTLSSNVFWRIYRLLINREIPPGGVDVFGCTRSVAQQLANLRETRSSLIGLLYWLGYNRKEISYTRLARTDGEKSGWTFRRKLRYMSDSTFSFTSLPIDILLGIGTVGTLGSLLWAVVLIVGRLSDKIEVPGFTALMVVILVSTSLILLALGIIGTYLWRVFENVKGRPLSIVSSHSDFNGSSSECPHSEEPQRSLHTREVPGSTNPHTETR